MTFRNGDRVHQHSYGAGDIIDINTHYVTIAFDDGGTRKFAAALVQLQPSIEPRPVRPTSKSKARPKRPKLVPEGATPQAL